MEEQVNLTAGVEQAWTNFITFLPKLVVFLAILVVGYFLAKLVSRGFDAILERVGFDRLVERGGIKRTLERTKYDASDLLSKILFYTIVLFVLQLAFGVFGPNPISELLTRVIAYIPNIFVAAIIVVVAAAIAAGVKEILKATMAGFSYGRYVAAVASIAILVVGIFAALDQLQIAPAIVNGLFYASLAVIAGSAIIAIGGGGIKPMQAQWERALNRMREEAPRLKEEAQRAPERAKAAAQDWKQQAQAAVQEEHHEERPHAQETPRFRT
jgi:MFS family permease